MRFVLRLWRRFAPAVLGAGLLSLAAGGVSAQTPPERLDAYTGSFSVGGQYKTVPGIGSGGASSTVMDGSMYVNYFIPFNVTHPYPIVLIHGGVGAGQAFITTPDGRPGWAPYFAKSGFAVYVVDQPGRGRSMYVPQLDGPVGDNTVLSMEQLFTATQDFNLWPQARLHTQWPGSGLQGDRYFDAFMRGTMGALTTPGLQETLNRASGAALLDRIGPAIVFGRSQSGDYPWLYADVRPHQLKAMIDIEGTAPAFNCPGIRGCGAPYNGNPATLTPLWGITNTPITYSPGITDPSQLVRVPAAHSDGADRGICWKQAEPARKLVNLIGVPAMVFVSQSSFAAQTEQCTAQYLTQAGVKTDFIRLENVGIFGNGHLMNSEKNSDQIAQFFVGWLASKGL